MTIFKQAQIKYLVLALSIFAPQCTFDKAGDRLRDSGEDSSLSRTITTTHPIPSLSLKIRAKALTLWSVKLASGSGKDTLSKVLEGRLPSTGPDQIPHYVKDILWEEVSGQKALTWSAPSNKPCFVDDKLIHPKDVLYALQRAAVGNTSEDAQGLNVPGHLRAISWKKVLGYELTTYKLLDQLERWFVEIEQQKSQRQVTEKVRRSLGLKVVKIPSNMRDYVRQNIVVNDLDLVTGGRGRNRDQIRCFLAKQVSSLSLRLVRLESNDLASNHPFPLSEYVRQISRLDLFDGAKVINFGILRDKSEVDTIDSILRMKEDVKGLFIDVKWVRNSSTLSLEFSPQEFMDRLSPDVRNRITEFYSKTGVLRMAEDDFVYRLFPNLKKLLIRQDYQAPEKLAAIINRVSESRVDELGLERVSNFSDVFVGLSDPLPSIKRFLINGSGNSGSCCRNDIVYDQAIDIAKVARVFSNAENVAIVNSKIEVNRSLLDDLHEKNRKVTWKTLYLGYCGSTVPGDRLNLVHSVFSDNSFKVSTHRCWEGLRIDEAPTFYEIRNGLLHQMLINILHPEEPTQC